MYTSPNYKTKKDLKEALDAGIEISIFSPGLFPVPKDGITSVEGPHYPKPHTWYARVEVKDGLVTKILS